MDISFQEKKIYERKEIKGMNMCEKWQLTDLEIDFAVVLIVRPENLLKQSRIQLLDKCLFNEGLFFLSQCVFTISHPLFSAKSTTPSGLVSSAFPLIF